MLVLQDTTKMSNDKSAFIRLFIHLTDWNEFEIV